jgi:predicted phage-related endonuclease
VFESKYDSGGRWDDIPDHYRLQVQWQLAVTGLDNAFVAVMHLPFGRPRFETYELARDQALVDRLLADAERFWFDHVVAGVPPLADGHRATTAALAAAWTDPASIPAVDVRSLSHVVDELRALRDARKRLDADIERDENLLKAALGTYTEGVIDGQVVVSWRPSTRHGLDTAALRADHPDLAERYVRATTSRTLRLHTPRATRRTA